jgi:hypothetical protein
VLCLLPRLWGRSVLISHWWELVVKKYHPAVPLGDRSQPLPLHMVVVEESHGSVFRTDGRETLRGMFMPSYEARLSL